MKRAHTKPRLSAEGQPRLVNQAAAAKYMGITIPMVVRLIKTGELRTVKLPIERRTFIDARDIDALIDRLKTRP